MVTHNITLNVKQQGPIDTGIEVTQGDYGKVQFVMRVKDDDSYITDATSAELIFGRPDGYYVAGIASVNAGTYTYVFAGNELQCPGKMAAVLTLGFADGRVSSCGFTFNCRYNPAYDRRVEAGPYIAELEKIRQQAQEQVDYLESLITQLQADLGSTALTRADLANHGLTSEAGLVAMDAIQANPNIVDTLAYKIARNAKTIADLNSDKINYADKPSGSYVGNGSATARTINVGGIESNNNLLYVYCNENGWNTLVSRTGNFMWNNSGNTDHAPYTESRVLDGKFNMATIHEALNASGKTYFYSMLV